MSRLPGSLCLQMGGGCAPPTPPPFVKPIHACYKKTQASCPSPCVAVREGCADHYVLANGGGCASPNPPAFLKPSMRAIKHKHHVIAVFAVGKGCADPCVCKWRGAAPPPQRPPPRFCKPHPCLQSMSNKLGKEILTVARMSYRV